jgi:glycine/D-amino acid oxidase-like deaminating enzyme
MEVAPAAPSLSTDESAGTVIAGSGITGLPAAYELAKRGQDGVVLDRGPIGKRKTSRTTARFTPPRRSARCTRAGCRIHWKRCWDWPCNGFQFASAGTPLNGPAVSALPAID